MSKPYGTRKPQRLLIPPEEERCPESSSGISDDLRYGQIVIVAARWMLVLSAFVLLLYRSDKINELVFGVVGLLGIAVANFWLHTKILRKQCVEPEWVYLASGADIAVISLMTWLQGGIWGRVFPYYYPAVLCYALVFQSGITMFFTGTVVAAYAVLAAMSSPPMQAGDDQVLRGDHLDKKGWQQVTFKVPQAAAYPLRVKRFYLAETRPASQYKGEVVLDEVVPHDDPLAK